MWIKRALFEELLTARSKAEGECAALNQRAIADQVTREWMAHRLTQLEHERAQLIFRYMDVKITTPVLESTPLPLTGTPPPQIGDLPSFQDVGDEEAKKLGLDWDPETGKVRQHGKVIE